MHVTLQKIESKQTSGEGYRLVIKKLLARDNISVSELARRIDLPQPTIHRLLTGKTEDPKLSTLMLIAEYFSITMDQLLGHMPVSNEPGKKMPLISHSVPILSWQEVINSKDIIPNLSVDNWDNWILIDSKTSDLIFGLKSKKCMEPRFPAGSVLIIDSTTPPEDGDLVIICYPNTTEATIRELVLDGPSQALISMTNNSISENLTKEIKVIGIVTQTHFSYK